MFNIITKGFPGYQAYLSMQNGKNEKIWLVYFLVLGVFGLLEWTVLVPVVWL